METVIAFYGVSHRLTPEADSEDEELRTASAEARRNLRNADKVKT